MYLKIYRRLNRYELKLKGTSKKYKIAMTKELDYLLFAPSSSYI